MDEEMVMRSVYLRPTEDAQLRQLAHDLKVTKSDLIRSAISVKLKEWMGSNDDALVLQDLNAGRREGAVARAARSEVAKAEPAKSGGVKVPGPKITTRAAGSASSKSYDENALALKSRELQESGV